MSAGITVLPVRSTRVAFDGIGTVPCFPTFTNLSPSTRNAECSIGLVPSPTISLAPSYKTAVPGRACVADTQTKAVASSDAQTTIPTARIGPSPSADRIQRVHGRISGEQGRFVEQ